MCSPTKLISSVISTIILLIVIYYAYQNKDQITKLIKTLTIQIKQALNN